MKIVHVVEAWKGGIASYVEVLIKDQLSRGCEVYLIADVSEFDSDLRDLGIPIIKYKSSRKISRLAAVSLDVFNKIKAMDVDVVHCHSSFSGFYVRVRSLKSLKCRIIYTPHSWASIQRDIGFLKRLFYRFAERMLAYRSDCIICMSMEEILEAKLSKIPASKLHLIYTGIPDVEFGNDVDNIEEKERRYDGVLRVGFFGRFDYQKGFDLVKDIGPLINDNVEVHFFGDVVRSKVENFSSDFIWHGWISHSEIPFYMNEMNIVLIPSRWEGFALTPLEAMRCGRAVIVSNQSSLPEVVVHGFNGLVLSELSPEHIANVLNELTRDECIRLGKNARSVYEQTFKSGAFLNKIDDIYKLSLKNS